MASVPAFEMLAEELAQGAPKNLVQRCLAAADDERRHAVSMGALARRFGSVPGGFSVLSSARQSAREIALHNAVEGCVREAYGALLATWQADHAQDPVVRATMRNIAADETRHAELSFDIARWFDSTLDEHAREASLAARKEALLGFPRGPARPPPGGARPRGRNARSCARAGPAGPPSLSSFTPTRSRPERTQHPDVGGGRQVWQGTRRRHGTVLTPPPEGLFMHARRVWIPALLALTGCAHTGPSPLL